MSTRVYLIVLIATIFLNSALTASPCPNPRTCARNSTDTKICATFQATFKNECVMKARLCRLARLGLHLVKREDLPKSFDTCCPQGVADVDSPICGSDGKTYDNEDLMNVIACNERRYIEKVEAENCPDFPWQYLSKENYENFWGIQLN